MHRNPPLSAPRRLALATAFVLSFLALPAGAQPPASPPGIQLAIERVYPALVRVLVVTAEPQMGRLRKYPSAGSGVIVSADGYVVTNHHVAGHARQVFCETSAGERLDAGLVATDPLADISVLKLDLSRRAPGAPPLPWAAWGDSDAVKEGDTVFAMGSPAALSQSVTSGIVSNTRMILPRFFWDERMKQDGEDVGSVVRWIGHDADIYGGNSGGPLVNAAGEIVGINEIGIGGIGGAIPGNLARQVVESLIATGRVPRSWTGLECQPRLRDSAETRGVLVGGVIPESPAAAAGLRAGDLLLSWDGSPVSAAIDEEIPLFNRLVLGTPVGKKVEIAALRDGREKVFTLVTVAREREVADAAEFLAWGITARDFTRMSALEARRPDRAGVQVDSIRPGGPASDARPEIQPGDVIVEVGGGPVRSVADLRSATTRLLAGKTGRVPTLVACERNFQKMLTVVRIGEDPESDPVARARKAWLPVATQVLTRELAEALGVPGETGVRVTQVYPGRSADGRLRVGDLVLKLDGEPIPADSPEHADVFPSMVRQRRSGTEVLLEGIRDGKPLAISVALEIPPAAAAELHTHRDDAFEFAARDLSFLDRVNLALPPDLQGVMVLDVEMAGWAAIAHLAPGDILMEVAGRPTPDIRALEQALAAVRSSRLHRIPFFVRRGIHTQYLELEPNWAELDPDAPPGGPARKAKP